MNRIKYFLIAFLALTVFSSCSLYEAVNNYEANAKGFVDAAINEDYDKCVSFMAMDHEMAKNTDVAAMKQGFAEIRQVLIDNFGKNLEFKFSSAEKRISNKGKGDTPPNTTEVLIEFNNGKDFGMLNLLFDDKSNKLLHVNIMDLKEAIPSMATFWLFGLLALCVPLFNIYVIRQIKQSNLTKKWRKYLAVIVLNAPTIIYSAVYGLSFKLINFQMLFGISISTSSYLKTEWAIGIPLAGIYWLIKLKKHNKEIAEAELQNSENLEPNHLIDFDANISE